MNDQLGGPRRRPGAVSPHDRGVSPGVLVDAMLRLWREEGGDA